MSPYRKWLIITLVIALVPLVVIGSFNFYIDPLWNFSHAHKYNHIQIPFDERQQKTNRITYGGRHYDTLILGSSRTTYMNQADLVGYNAFNYAVSGMLMEEYHDYVEYAKLKNGRDFDYIVIGLDFFTTNKNLEQSGEYHSPSYYIDKSNQFAYRLKTMLSFAVLDYSRKNYNASKINIPVTFDYDRNNVKTLNQVPETVRAEHIKTDLAKYRQHIYAHYEYRDVRRILTSLKESNPNTTFIVFTTPVSQPLFALMAEQNLFPYYERWLRDSVVVFGQVYNFMYLNSITTNLENYYDSSHVYPGINTLIAHRIINYPDIRIPKDFGVLLTKDNIEGHLRDIH